MALAWINHQSWGEVVFTCGAAVKERENMVFRGECALLWKRQLAKDSGRLVFHAEARAKDDSLLRRGILRTVELGWGWAA